MASFEYDGALVEAAVFSEIRARESAGDGRIANRYFRDVESIYEFSAGSGRDDAAREKHRTWFAELELDRYIPAASREVGLSVANVSRVFVHSAASAREESADLFQKETGKTLVIAVLPARFNDSRVLLQFLRHELLLIADLLDPEFDFHGGDSRSAAGDPGSTPIALVRDRYRLLWKISCDGRLARKGYFGIHSADEWKLLFDRAFGFLPEAARVARFEMLHNGPRPPHAELWNFASDPRGVAGAAASQATPGSRCPLCKFPTFDWAAGLESLPADVTALIQTKFAAWNFTHGACRECIDRYYLAATGAAH